MNEAIRRWQEGHRTWDPARVDLEGFLRGVIRSVASSERKHWLRTDAANDHTVDPSEVDIPAPSPEDEAIAEERRQLIIATIERGVNGDEELELLVLAWQEGDPRREAVANTLGWDAERVTRARIRLQRRLEAIVPPELAHVMSKKRRKP